MDQPTASEGLRALEPLVGRWSMEAFGPDGLSIMGCDGATGTYVQLYSDERGVSRIYQMSMDDGRWELWRQGDPFPQRFRGSFSHDHNTISGQWEKAEDGITFGLDFTVVYRRLLS
jgi:hypothetical protein